MNRMSKEKKNVKKSNLLVAGAAKVDNLKDKDLKVWAEFFGLKEFDEGTEEVLTELETRVANLGDVTAITKYLDKIQKEELMHTLKMMTERMSVLEYIVTDKLNVTMEEIQDYTVKYHKEMEEVKAEMEKIMKESAEEEENGEPSLEIVKDNEEG